MLGFYVPLAYYMDRFFYHRHLRKEAQKRQERETPHRRRASGGLSRWTSACSPSARSPRTASCSAQDGSDRALIVDPGDEAERILARGRRARRRRSRRSCSPTPTSTTSARSRRSRKATGAPV